MHPIQAVREAETESEEMVRQAAARAAQMVDEAQQEAMRLRHQLEDEAREGAAAQVAEAHRQSQHSLEASTGSLNQKMEQLAERARQNQGAAVRLILDSLV